MKNILVNIILTASLLILSFGSSAATTLRFGVIDFYPPFVFTSKEQTHGFDIEVATAVCQRLKVQCTFTPMSLPQLFASLNQSKVDAIIGAISITSEREKQFDFSRPYLKSTMSFVSLVKSAVNDQQLQGKKVGVIKDSTFYHYLVAKYGNSINLVVFNTNQELIYALTNKQVDIVLLDTPAANYWARYSMGLLKLVGKPQFLSDDSGYGIVVQKGNTTLVNQINAALVSLIKDGYFKKLTQSYFSRDYQS